MRIATTILSGGNREHMIGNAIRSAAAFSDAFLFIRTGDGADEAIRVGTELCRELGTEAAWYQFPGDYSQHSCADGRNYCLELAEDLSFTWACILDTDEELQIRCDIRDVLAKTKAETVRVWSRDGVQQYTKDRFIRTGTTGRYVYPVHESFKHDGPTEILSPLQATFTEAPKTQEQTRANAQAIERACREWLVLEPGCYRAAYYLADALDVQGRKDEAIDAFRIASAMSTNDTEHGEAMLRAAQLQAMLGRFDDCRLTCLSAMFTATHMPEFPWLMALMHHEREAWDHVLDCANMAIALGRTTNLATVRNLTQVLKVEMAHTYGPWALRRDALRGLGLEEDAKRAEEIVREMKEQAVANG